MTATVSDLTAKTFDEEVGPSEVPVVVEFWATWCPPCRAMGPVLASVAADYEGRLRVMKVNVESEPELARRFEVASTPTYLVFEEGRVKGRMTGARGRHNFLENVLRSLS